MSGTTSPTIGVPGYPSNNLVPGVYGVIDASQANSGGLVPLRTLIIGQMLPSGVATPNVARISSGLGDALTQYGAGSICAVMLTYYRLRDPNGEVWVLPVPDASGATAAVWTATPTGPATGPGTLYLRGSGKLLTVGVNNGDSAVTIGTNIAAAINADPTLPYTAAVNNSTGVVTITAKNAGALDVNLTANFKGLPNEPMPAGVGLTFAQATAGATNPSIAAALANLPNTNFDVIVVPWNDAGTLSVLDGFLSDSTGRWAWNSELFGGYFCAMRGSQGTITGFATTRNGDHGFMLGYYGGAQPSWMWAANFAGACAVSLNADPALTLTQLPLDVDAPLPEQQWTMGQENTLLYDGCSTYYVGPGNTVYIQRVVSFYQQNAAGAPDNSWRDCETSYTLMAGVRDLRTYLQSVLGAKKLVQDGTPIGAGSNLVTAQAIKALVVSRYQYQCSTLGIMQDPTGFAKAVRAQNAGNGLVKLYVPLRLANQLRVVALDLQFIKP